MKKSIIYSAIVLLLASVACNKTDHSFTGDGNIRFAPASTETRALIENATALQAQKFEVYDLMGEETYIKDSIAYASGAWNYLSNKTYSWKDGSHKFFGFTKDAGTLATDVLTVNKTLTTAEADQVDLLYSEIFSTTAAAWKATEGNTVSTPVALNMKHLFAAVSIMVKNATTGAVTVNSVNASIKNSGTATVKFDGDSVKVAYTAPSVSGAFISAQALSDVELAGKTDSAEGGMVDVFTQAAATSGTYEMVWPQTIAEGAQVVNVVYTMNGSQKTAAVKIPAITWEAGKKYSYVLNIYPTKVELTFVVMPWDVAEVGSIDTSTGSINMSNVTWMNSKVYVGDELVNTLFNKQYKVVMYKNAYLAVAQKYTTDVYDVYAEDVVDEDSGEVIHHAGDPNYDVILHKAGDYILDEDGQQVYQKGGASPYTYYPAQGFFTVNYPKSGLFKITLIQAAYWDDPVPEGVYEVWIYENGAFRKMKDAGETITNDTVYFQIRANADNITVPHDEYRCQVDVLFKPTGSDEWISAYSEVRANYACVIEAETN